MNNVIDNHELAEVMEILENVEDQQVAVKLLKEFNDKTKTLGMTLLNQDPNVEHDEWKKNCDFLKSEVDSILKEIYSYK